MLKEMQYLRHITIGAIVLIVFGILFAIYEQRIHTTAPVDVSTTATTEPQRTDFGTNAPTDFPTDIPVEKGIKFEQSYSLNYVGQKQLTIVFLSTKTIKENYALYADFLKKQNWTISNKYESDKLSSLYGTKDSNDINVTISESTSTTSAKSQVSISILKK